MIRIVRFRNVGLVSAWMAVALACSLVSGQDAAVERRTPRIPLPQTLEQFGSDVRATVPRRNGTETIPVDREPNATDRIREFARTKIKVTPRNAPVDALAELGARAPFDYSSGGAYLVAATRDDAGLALWEMARRRRLSRLENSDRSYALVAISDDARWIAGVRGDDSDQVDLWRTEHGRHVRVIRAAGGPKSKLEFEPGDQLRVVAANGNGLLFSVPDGVAIGGFGSAQGGIAMKRSSARFDSAKAAPPAPPSTARSLKRAVPPAQPPASAERALPGLAKPALPTTPTPEPLVEPAPAPRMAMRRESRAPKSPPTAVEAPAESSSESAFVPASPAPDEPAPTVPFEPSGGSAPAEPMTAAPDEPSEGAATEPTTESLKDPGTTERDAALPSLAAEPETAPESEPAPTSPAAQFRTEMVEEPLAATEPAAPATAQPPVVAPPVTSVNIHYATNRNRLAPQDRAFGIYFREFFGSLPAFIIYVLIVLSVLILPWFGKRSWGAGAIVIGCLAACAMGMLEAYVRSQLRDELTGERYGCRPTDLSYGTCEVSVPPPQNRRPGDVSRPLSVWIFEAPENPEKHFVLRHVAEHPDKDAFYQSLSAQLKKSDAPAALLFIHGYNVSFEDAVFRTAQLAVDLKFPGAPIAYCWPSYADPVKYTFDEQSAEVSIPALGELLVDLAARSGAQRIHIIAHSMGNRVLAGALENMDSAAQARNKEVFRELVLAAPDIDSRVFRTQVLPHIVNNTQHCTLYASSRDRALWMSRRFHNFQRLGEAQPELLVASGLDTIDATMVDTSLLGHSYIGDAQSIVADLHDLVVGGKRATERLGLEAFQRNALKYWSIKPQLETAADPSVRR